MRFSQCRRVVLWWPRRLLVVDGAADLAHRDSIRAPRLPRQPHSNDFERVRGEHRHAPCDRAGHEAAKRRLVLLPPNHHRAHLLVCQKLNAPVRKDPEQRRAVPPKQPPPSVSVIDVPNSPYRTRPRSGILLELRVVGLE